MYHQILIIYTSWLNLLPTEVKIKINVPLFNISYMYCWLLTVHFIYLFIYLFYFLCLGLALWNLALFYTTIFNKLTYFVTYIHLKKDMHSGDAGLSEKRPQHDWTACQMLSAKWTFNSMSYSVTVSVTPFLQNHTWQCHTIHSWLTPTCWSAGLKYRSKSFGEILRKVQVCRNKDQ